MVASPIGTGMANWRLERALLFTFVMHGLGMLSMALVLLPGMPGGGTVTDSVRIGYIAAHPWLWRLGWLPWQLTALSDLLLAVALLRTPAVPKLASVLTALVTVAAIIPDQLGQACWITRGIELAKTEPARYVAYETRIFVWTAAWGATLYTVGALGWTWCFAKARFWNRWLTLISAFLWPLFFAVSLGPFFGLNGKIVAAGNALGFVLLEVWLALVCEQVLRSSRPAERHGRLEPWHHPRFAGLDLIANSRFLRACAEWIPVAAFRSDVRDVIYVNYLVPAERLHAFVPVGLELQRLGADGRYALFTFLSYRHGSLGPRFLGPLRKLLPSPFQSNWRVYVRHARSGREGVYFVTNAISSTLHALAARLLCEGMPMHVPIHAEITKTEALSFRLLVEPGSGSAPDVDAYLEFASEPSDGPFRSCFGSWTEFLAYAVPQDRALSTQPWRNRLTSQEIDLGISLADCRALSGEVRSVRAHELVGEAEPICFFVPRVTFKFEREIRLLQRRTAKPEGATVL